MHVIITCKYEKDLIKNSQEKLATPFFSIITLFVAMETSSRIGPNFKLIQALTYVIVTCKYEKDPIKNSREKVVHTVFFHFRSMGIFSDAKGQLTLQSVVGSGRNSNSFELSCMSSLPACMKRIGLNCQEKVATPFFPL